MNVTTWDWTALYGAVVATVAILWNVYTWFNSGARLAIDWRIPDDLKTFQGQRIHSAVEIRVRNNGSGATTIFALRIKARKRFYNLTEHQPAPFEAAGMAGAANGFNHVLEPGRVWRQFFARGDIEGLAEQGYKVKVGVVHSAGKPKWTRIDLTKQNSS